MSPSAPGNKSCQAAGRRRPRRWPGHDKGRQAARAACRPCIPSRRRWPTGLPTDPARRAGSEVHVTHVGHAAAGTGALRLRLLGDHRLGGDQQAGHGRGTLQGDTHDLGRVDDAGLDQVGIFAGLGVEAPSGRRLLSSSLPAIDGTVGAGILGDLTDRGAAGRGFTMSMPACWSSNCRPSAWLECLDRPYSRATPPPGTMPSCDRGAGWRCSASSTRSLRFLHLDLGGTADLDNRNRRRPASPAAPAASRGHSPTRSRRSAP